MTHLAKTILRLIESGRISVGVHMQRMLDDRKLEAWHLEQATADGRLIAERPSAKPNPAIELTSTLPDCTPCKIVWSLVDPPGLAKLVTLHFYDRP